MFTDNTELKKLILENPELPLLFLASEEANSGNYGYELAIARFHKGICLDCPKNMPIPNAEIIYTDKEDFECELRGWLYEKYFNLSNDEFDAVISSRMEEYEPYWKECIIITVDSY